MNDAGAGNIIMSLIRGKTDYYMYPYEMGHWDYCAPEALLKGMFGQP